MATTTALLPEFLDGCRVRRKPLSLSLAKRQKFNPSSPEPAPNARALFFGKFGARYEAKLEEWSEETLARFFNDSVDLVEPPLVTLVRCGKDAIIVDFIYRQVIYLNPEENSEFKAAWTAYDPVDYRLVTCNLPPERLAKLRGVSFVPKLSQKLVSVQSQLIRPAYEYEDVPQPFIKALRTGLRSHKDGKKLLCQGFGKCSIQEVRRVLEKVYPHIYLELVSPLEDDPFRLLNIPTDKRDQMLAVLNPYGLSKDDQKILSIIIGVFRNCLRVYKEAHIILLSYSHKTELFDFFTKPPPTYDIGIYMGLHAISQQMELKNIDL